MDSILVVDDDDHIREVISFALQKAGFSVLGAKDGADALTQFEKSPADLIVLDIMMPEMEGTDVCRRIRKSSTVPIIFLSSKDEEIDRIIGLELGGDDYMTKPFSPRELVARIHAIFRRIKTVREEGNCDQANNLSSGRLRIDLDQFKTYWQEQELVLTVTEFNIVKTLLSRPQKVFTRDQLMDGAYDLNRLVSDRTIDSHVRRVRGKFACFGADPIETVHGLGYKLVEK